MELLTSYGTGLALAGLLILLHYEVLSRVARFSRRHRLPHRLEMITAMFGVFIGHTLEIALYAVAYHLLQKAGFGTMGGDFEATPLGYYQFSAISFTTLGLTKAQPTGGFGVLSALEGLTGFSLITWSATYGYSLMQDLWGERMSD